MKRKLKKKLKQLEASLSCIISTLRMIENDIRDLENSINPPGSTAATTNSPYYKLKLLGWFPDVVDKAFAVNCSSIEQAKQLCTIFTEMGLRWAEGDSYAENIRWNFDIGYTCYYPFDGIIRSPHFFDGHNVPIKKASVFIENYKKFKNEQNES